MGEPMMGGQSPLLELLHGRGAHVSPLASVEDLSAELAGASVSGFPYSAWQILGHLNYWMEYDFERIDGHAAPYPACAADSWPRRAKPGGETEWHSEVLRFAENLRAMERLAKSDEVLTRPVEIITPAHAGQSNSVEALLWQTIAHNSYHVGQIVLLRRFLRAWPPPAGGDTW
jgi:uncharacterized damage-inducible protein DinB